MAPEQIKATGLQSGTYVDLAGQSGGVQRMLAGSRYLSELDIGVNTIVGVQGPSFGRFVNAENIVLYGNAVGHPFVQSNADPISQLGALSQLFTWGDNIRERDFSIQLNSPSESRHETPGAHTTFTDIITRDLLKYRGSWW